ncbi:hypothetical protein KAI52_01280 [Candidatus Parcubacteria bacterium]|nr:hypothetical protein [Candidatus Parcubacteria bacterium]
MDKRSSEIIYKEKEICLEKIKNLWDSLKHASEQDSTGWSSKANNKHYDELSERLKKEEEKLEEIEKSF